MTNTKYFLLQTLSDEPVILDEEQRSKLLKDDIDANCFLVQEESKLVDVVVDEEPGNFPLNFTPLISLGIVRRSFLTQMIPFEQASLYINFSKILLRSGDAFIETDFLLYKCKNVIYARAKSSSIFKTGEKSKKVIYVPDGKEYVTNIPSDSIPIYGTQLRGQLIVRGDLVEKIIRQKNKKLHMAELSVKKPIDGFEFNDVLMFK